MYAEFRQLFGIAPADIFRDQSNAFSRCDFQTGHRDFKGLAARLASLRVEAGHGLKPLTSSDEQTILRHARDCLGADAAPEVTFVSTSISREADSVAIQGQLSIAGQTRSIDATVALTDEDEHWTVVSVLPVKQSDFGVTPYATMLGMLQVADEVRVEVRVAISK